jgi:hypothetical protein
MKIQLALSCGSKKYAKLFPIVKAGNIYKDFLVLVPAKVAEKNKN